MRYCPTCGASLGDSSRFCPNCGASVTADRMRSASQQPSAYRQPNTPRQTDGYWQSSTRQQRPAAQRAYPAPDRGGMQFRDEISFFNQFASRATVSWVKTMSIICFITSAAALVEVFLGNLFTLIDLVIYLVFGILILLYKKWYLSLTIAIVSGLGTLATLISSGKVLGIGCLVVSIFATIQLKKISNAYKQYVTYGTLPQLPI